MEQNFVPGWQPEWAFVADIFRKVRVKGRPIGSVPVTFRRSKASVITVTARGRTAQVQCPNLKWNFASVTPEPSGINKRFRIERGFCQIKAINSLVMK